MNKYNFLRLSLIFVSCFVLITTCQKEDKVDTNQLGDKEITLKSFGPCPIARGAELRIIGTNLDKVESVTIPGSGDISSITRISKTEIRMTIPQNAEPGLIALNAGGKVITSITRLTFSEPMSIEKMTPLTAKAGAKIKIEGDYLNLIKEIFFMDGVSVRKDDFVSQSREAIEVILPIKAQTGKVIVSNGADILTEEEIAAGKEPGIPIWVYSDEELVVVLPSITSFSPSPIRAGAELTIAGKDFDLVEKVSFGGDRVAESFTVNGEKTSITVTVPANAQDGTIVLTAFSGVKVLSATDLIMVVPTISAVSPNPVKNGTVLTVTGTNLDLVDKVIFGGNKQGTIEEGRTATEIKVKVPMDAIDGKVRFTTLAAKEVESADLTMVKPTVTAYTPSPVPGGSVVKIQGTDLDLVVSVTFPDNLVVPVKNDNANELSVTVPMTAVSGVVVLTLTNGEKVNVDMQISTPLFAIIPELPGPDKEIKAGSVLVVEIINEDKLTAVHVKGAPVQYILIGKTLYIQIPNNAKGDTQFKLVSSNGEAVYILPVIPMGKVENVIWQGLHEIGWGGGALSLPAAQFAGVPEGAIMTLHFQQKPDTWSQIQILDGGWGTLSFPEVGGGTWVPTDIGGWNNLDYNSQEFVLSQEILDQILSKQATEGDWLGAGIIMQGSDLIFTKAVLSWENQLETVLWQGSAGPIGWDATGLIPIDLSLLAPGKILGVDFVCGENAELEVLSGSWWMNMPSWEALNGGDRYIKKCDPSETNIEFKITQADIDNIRTQGSSLLFVGGNVTIKRVYIL